MNKVRNLPWWAALGLDEPVHTPDTDYADMGTAFGLDASIRPEDMPQGESNGDAGPSTDRLNRRSVI
jgi:hypothetical protein